MTESEKLKFIEDALEKGLAAMEQMVEALRDVTDCLSDMTEHYVRLAGCGDCGFWDPEQESEVIAARKMIASVRADLAGLDIGQPALTQA